MSKISRSKRLNLSEVQLVEDSSSRLTKGGTCSFDDALAALLTVCVKEGYAEATMTHYQNELRVFSYYLRDMNPKGLKSIYAIKPMDIVQFIDYMRNIRSAKTGNINTKLKALKRFLRVNGLNNLATHCSPLPDEKYKVKAFSLDEVTRLLSSCDLETFIGLRDYTIMLVLADTGIRVSELCNLLESDFSSQEGTLYIRETKNYYNRYAPISSEVAKMVKVLISVNSGDDHIFQTLHGRSLSRVAVQRRVNMAGKRANIGKNTRCSPHTFRHYYAKTMVENGVNVFELQNSSDIVR